MKKRMISILAVGALLLSLTACDGQAAGTKGKSNTTYTGTVSAISTQSITVSTDAGEVTIPLTAATAFSSEFGMGGQMPGNMGQIPDGMGDIPSDMGEFPEGTGNNMSEIPTGGEAPGGMEVPPGGDAFGSADQGGTPPELPEGESNPNDITAMDPMLNQAQSATIAVVFIGAAVTVVTDANGAAATVTVSGGNLDGMQQPG